MTRGYRYASCASYGGVDGGDLTEEELMRRLGVDSAAFVDCIEVVARIEGSGGMGSLGDKVVAAKEIRFSMHSVPVNRGKPTCCG